MFDAPEDSKDTMSARLFLDGWIINRVCYLFYLESGFTVLASIAAHTSESHGFA